MNERLTIVEAIIRVLEDSEAPLTGKEIFARIMDRGLYAFKAKDPSAVMMAQLRKHRVGATKGGAAPKYFATDDGQHFKLATRKSTKSS